MPPTSDPLTASERNALGTATNTATGISAALRILQNYQRSEAVSDEANARAESMMTTLRDQQGARSSTALGNAAFAQAQRLIAIAQTREDLAVAQRLLELAQQQQQASPSPTPPTPGGQRPPADGGSPSTPTWVWVTGGLVVVATVAVVGGIYVGRRQRLPPPPPPPTPVAPRPTRSQAPSRRTREPQGRARNG